MDSDLASNPVPAMQRASESRDASKQGDSPYETGVVSSTRKKRKSGQAASTASGRMAKLFASDRFNQLPLAPWRVA